jgi:hypothetical protein
VPTIQHRTDVQGPAGDPYLESPLKIDDLKSQSLLFVDSYSALDLLDNDTKSRLPAMAE